MAYSDTNGRAINNLLVTNVLLLYSFWLQSTKLGHSIKHSHSSKMIAKLDGTPLCLQEPYTSKHLYIDKAIQCQ